MSNDCVDALSSTILPQLVCYSLCTSFKFEMRLKYSNTNRAQNNIKSVVCFE